MKAPIDLDTMVLRVSSDSAVARSLQALCNRGDVVAPIRFMGSLFIMNYLESGRISIFEDIGKPYIQVGLQRLHDANEPACGDELRVQPSELTPIPMLLVCPACKKRHLDEGEFSTKPHHTHACQYCGTVWRPAIVPTVGVQFLPGFKNK